MNRAALTSRRSCAMMPAMAPMTLILKQARRWIAGLLLLVVSAHALAPHAQPLERSTGSAFSSATADVSLAWGQPAAVVKRALPASPVPVLVLAIVLPAAFSFAAETQVAVASSQTGPPPDARTAFSPLSPRAPPAA